jgi:hypothetical protein
MLVLSLEKRPLVSMVADMLHWGQTYIIDEIACFQENLICLLFEITAIEGAKDGEAFTDLISRSFLSCYLRRE